jgi:hypothetical protein
MKTCRTVFLIILVSVIGTRAECQKTETKAKLKSIIVTEEKSDMLIKKQYKESETYFDINGNVIEDITYKKGIVDKHFKYEYNADNIKIKEEEFDQSGKLIETSEYRIENGLRVEKVVYIGNKKVKSRKVYKYTTY